MPLDLVIRSGTVIDGTGAAPRTADVAIAEGCIVASSKLPSSYPTQSKTALVYLRDLGLRGL
jgi:N-acyl-D-aspartate/D-glutamate deacylase